MYIRYLRIIKVKKRQSFAKLSIFLCLLDVIIDFQELFDIIKLC